jgi:hypothetical protein
VPFLYHNIVTKSRWFDGVLLPYDADAYTTEFVAKWYMDKDAIPKFSVHQIVAWEGMKRECT